MLITATAQPLIPCLAARPPSGAVHYGAYESPYPNVVPRILARAGRLSATEAVDAEPLLSGHIDVAPPDYHLVVTPGHLRVTRSATGNRFRPAIDLLLCSAAVVYDPRVVAVLLSGRLDDGTTGLWAVKERGGTAVVQAPHNALYPSMPTSAITCLPVNYALPATEHAQEATHRATWCGSW